MKDNLLAYTRCIRVGKNDRNVFNSILKEGRSIRQDQAEDDLIKTICYGPNLDFDQINREGGTQGLELHPVDLSITGLPSPSLIPAYGLALKGIEKVPLNINLMPLSFRKKAGKAGYYVMFILSGLLILSALSWGGGNIVRQRVYLDKLNKEIRRFGVEIGQVEQRRTRCQELEDKITYLNTLNAERRSGLEVLSDISLKTPESAWLNRFTISDNDVRIGGYADSASELLLFLDESTLFKEAVFLSPITKGKDGKERFNIGFKIN